MKMIEKYEARRWKYKCEQNNSIYSKQTKSNNKDKITSQPNPINIDTMSLLKPLENNSKKNSFITHQQLIDFEMMLYLNKN